MGRVVCVKEARGREGSIHLNHSAGLHRRYCLPCSLLAALGPSAKYSSHALESTTFIGDRLRGAHPC